QLTPRVFSLVLTDGRKLTTERIATGAVGCRNYGKVDQGSEILLEGRLGSDDLEVERQRTRRNLKYNRIIKLLHQQHIIRSILRPRLVKPQFVRYCPEELSEQSKLHVRDLDRSINIRK